MSSSLTAPLFMTAHKRAFDSHEAIATSNSKAHGAAHNDDDDDDNVFTSTSSSNASKRAPKRRATSSATVSLGLFSVTIVCVYHVGLTLALALIRLFLSAYNAQHELRVLREETALLQYQLDSLKLKWRRLGVDSDLLSHACDAALAKRESKRASALNKQFKAQLLQQQLFFASIQSLMLSDCPLLQVLRAKDVFECLHLPLRLPAKDLASNKTRKTKLQGHCETSLRLAPAVMNRFAHAHVDKASTSVPFSHTSIMGDAEFTYVASVFVCRLRNLSVEQVFNAAMAYNETLPLELKRCLGIDMEIEDDDSGNENDGNDEELQKLSLVHKRQQTRYSRKRYCNKGSGITSTQNSVFAAQLTEHRGVVLSDFVDHDDNDKDDVGLKRELETTSAIVITAMQDKETGEHQVLLQRLFVNRYALPATSRKLHDDVKSTTALLNGDLLMAVVCRELQSQVVH